MPGAGRIAATLQPLHEERPSEEEDAIPPQIVRRLLAHERTTLLALLALALVARIVAVSALGIAAPPVARADDADYHRLAVDLVERGRWGSSWFPPGYPLYLAAIYSLFGIAPAAARLVQSLLGILSCWLAYRLVRPRWGAIAALSTTAVMAIYPGYLYLTWRLMAGVPFTLLLILGTHLALLAAEQGRSDRAAAAGTTLGMASAFKSNLLPFPWLLVPWLLLARRRQGGNAAAPVLAMLLGIGLVSILTPLANAAAAGGSPSLVAGNAGHTLWWSNNPLARGYFVDPSHHPIESELAREYGLADAIASDDPFERDRGYARLALHWIAHHPGAWLRLVGHKLANGYGLFPYAAVMGSRVARLGYALSWGIVLSAALVGMALSWHRVIELAPVVLLILTHLAMTVMFYGTPRFTLPVVWAFAIFAGLAAAHLLADSAARAP